MSSKLEQLKKLRNQLDIEVEGIENYPKNEKALMIANHHCLMDIFYVPCATLTPQISVVSSRLTFKQIPSRKNVLNTYLHTMPIEAGGGSIYASICIDHIVDTFTKAGGVSLSVFPEGLYVPGKDAVYRGKTGASRILFQTRDKGLNVQLLPVAIQHNGIICDTDSYKLEEFSNHPVKIKILEPINYEEYYYQYKNSITKNEANFALHGVLDEGLSKIAKSINLPYINEYMDAYEKTNVIFPDGTYLEQEEAFKKENIKKYQSSLTKKTKQLLKELK